MERRNSAVKRPALYWQGSKWRIAPWVISFFPAHRIYVEPFGGSAAVLLRKEPAPGFEAWNDVRGDVVNFFRVLRDPAAGAELARRCRLTPHARAEWVAAKAVLKDGAGDAIQQAWAFWTANKLSTGARAGSSRNGATGFQYCAKGGKHDPKRGRNGASATASSADNLAAASERLRRVVIEQKDALALFPQYDTPETLFYVDPPYNAKYAMTYAADCVDHAALLDALQALEGFVVLSGYPSELYAERLAGWHLETRQNRTFVNTARTECLWLSPRTWEALQAERAEKGAVA